MLLHTHVTQAQAVTRSRFQKHVFIMQADQGKYWRLVQLRMEIQHVIMSNFISEIKLTHIDIIHYMHGNNKAMFYHVFRMDFTYIHVAIL